MGEMMKQKNGKNFKETTKELFLKYTTIPISLTIILFLIFTIFIFKYKIIYDAKQSANNIEEKIVKIHNIYETEVERMATSPTVIQTLQTGRKTHLVYEKFYNFNNQQEIKSAFHLIDNRHVFLASTTPSDNEVSKIILNKVIPWIEKEPDGLYLDAVKTEFPNGKNAVLNIGKAVKKDEEIVGYIIYQLYEEDIERLIFGEKADIVVLTDRYDYIIGSTNSIVVGLMNKFTPVSYDQSQIKIKNDNYYVSKLETPDNQFAIYALKNKKSNHFILLLYIVFIAIIGITLYFLLTNLAERMSKQNVESIDKLVKAVSRLEKGDMKSFVTIKTGDEFEVLATHYNTMLVNLNELMERNKELSNIHRVNEIKLLESQFNPHFLFNVLETLRYTMVTDMNEAQDIIITLSRLLRYSINIDNLNVPFEKDINYIQDYLQLHKYRFNERLDYTIKVEEPIWHVSVPRLLLQPFIENAIKYGYRHQTNLQITIIGKIIENSIIFTVTDNGGGIEKTRLELINKTLYSNGKSNPEIGIGLFNTHRRIVLQYGNSYGLSIESVKGEETEVQVKLPYKGVTIDV